MRKICLYSRIVMRICQICWFLVIAFVFSDAQNFVNDYRNKYEIASLCEGCRPKVGPSSQLIGACNDEVAFDSLPPRMRGFGDEHYFQAFIKPKQRDSLNVRCVGRWPFGPGFEVYGNSATNILCFGAGSGVLVFDISDPGNPVRLSQIAVNGLIMQIYIKDSLLFVASYGDGIEVFNLANPSLPVKISQINIPARDFCIKDTFLYSVAEDSLRIINIADIFNPYQVGACWDSSYTISISGNYVYTGGRWKLSAINVSNPQNPQVVNYLPLFVYTLTCDGNHLYCVISDVPGFRIFNISNPLNIWQEGELGVGGVDIYKLGFYVYLPGFVIVDVGDSANPFVVGDTSLPVYAQAVWVNNNFGYAYIANDYVGLTPININNPTNPIAQNSIYGADDSRDVFVQGNYAYVANARKGLKIIDISDPSMPFEVGEYDTAGILPNLESSWARDTFVYVPTSVFKILNIQNPNNPVLIGVCPIATGYASDICLRDSFACLIEGRVFQSVKISNPYAPESLPRYWLPFIADAYALFISDTFAYIADGDSGLRILNISNPASPFEVGHFDNPPGGGATGIFVKDTLAYFATWGGGLRILNVKNPSLPVEIGNHPSAALDVVVKDTIAYVTSNQGRVNIISVADPVNPSVVGYYDYDYYVGRLFLDSSLIYVSCYESGLLILEWTGVGITEHDKRTLASCGVDFRVFPNPSQGAVEFTFVLSDKAEYQVDIFDIQGRRVECLVGGENTGFTKKAFTLHNIPCGVYFAILKVDGKELVRKFVVVR